MWKPRASDCSPKRAGRPPYGSVNIPLCNTNYFSEPKSSTSPTSLRPTFETAKTSNPSPAPSATSILGLSVFDPSTRNPGVGNSSSPMELLTIADSPSFPSPSNYIQTLSSSPLEVPMGPTEGPSISNTPYFFLPSDPSLFTSTTLVAERPSSGPSMLVFNPSEGSSITNAPSFSSSQPYNQAASFVPSTFPPAYHGSTEKSSSSPSHLLIPSSAPSVFPAGPLQWSTITSNPSLPPAPASTQVPSAFTQEPSLDPSGVSESPASRPSRLSASPFPTVDGSIDGRTSNSSLPSESPFHSPPDPPSGNPATWTSWQPSRKPSISDSAARSSLPSSNPASTSSSASTLRPSKPLSSLIPSLLPKTKSSSMPGSMNYTSEAPSNAPFVSPLSPSQQTMTPSVKVANSTSLPGSMNYTSREPSNAPSVSSGRPTTIPSVNVNDHKVMVTMIVAATVAAMSATLIITVIFVFVRRVASRSDVDRPSRSIKIPLTKIVSVFGSRPQPDHEISVIGFQTFTCEMSTLGDPPGLSGMGPDVLADHEYSTNESCIFQYGFAKEKGVMSFNTESDEEELTNHWPEADGGPLEAQHVTGEQYEVHAPPGVLGLILESKGDGTPVVSFINPTCVLRDTVQVGDGLLSVDGIDVTVMLATDISRMIASKKNQADRFFVFRRPPLKELGGMGGSTSSQI